MKTLSMLIVIHGQQRKGKLVDEYIRQLSDMGISLHSLKLLGDFEIPEEDRKLTERELIDKILTDKSYKDQKDLIEKYISEFVRADLITQSTHLRNIKRVGGKKLVNPDNEYEIDGGVYIYRTPEKDKDGNMVGIDDDLYLEEVNEDSYVQMSYETPEKFEKLVNSTEEKDRRKLRYKYTIDEDGQLEIAKVKTVEKRVNGTVTEKITTVNEVVHMDYKSYIEKYTMPYEFLINLCMITENPEFVYHVAKLARETEIILVVQDDTTMEVIVDDIQEKRESYINRSSSSRSDATVTSSSTITTINEKITTEMTPHLEIKQANTWSFYDKFEYMKEIEIDGPHSSTTVNNCGPSTLPDHHLGSPHNTMVSNGVYETTYPDEYWSGDNLLVQVITTTTTTTTTTKYKKLPQKEEDHVEKSKQFLGLLRNKTGKCTQNNCYKDKNKVEKCIKYAEFKKDGINVEYLIPNSTNKDAPLNRLTSGLQMLYQLLGENLQGNSGNEEKDELNSEYKTKMTGIVDHIKYLMGFPENEDIDYTQKNPDYEKEPDYDEPIDEDEINVDDLIVKTDEEGALPAVSKEEIVIVINRMYSGKRKENAISIVNDLIDCQDTYKVNAIFVLAFADQESNIGTANTKWVNKHNNWLSWNLGHVFSSPQENVQTAMRLIATGKNYFTVGKITIKDIGLTYCPNMDDYPHQGDDWVINVTNKVKRMYSMIGIDITGGGNTGGGEGAPGSGNGTNDVRGTYTVNGRTYKEYKQDSGSSWERNKFAGGTMKSSGCSITSVAIILTGYGEDVTPEDIRQEVNGKVTNLVTLLQKHGVNCQRPGRALTAEQIRGNLQSGKPIIANVKGEWTSSSGHYMTLLDYRNKDGKEEVYVSNPGTVNSSKNGWVALSRITNNMKTQSILITE